ncbi:MAG TPA: hypothetical protein VFW96_09860 [Thermomicrobiales bacterium]|nr:hypothetical protein [Thermomicrobiales bacterium]
MSDEWDGGRTPEEHAKCRPSFVSPSPPSPLVTHHSSLLSSLIARLALLAGYRRVRPLPARQVRALPALVAGRVLARTLWIAAHRDDAVFRPLTVQRIAAQIATLRRLAGE